MRSPGKVVEVSPVLFASVSRTFDEFCRRGCFAGPCLAGSGQVVAARGGLVCLGLVFVHFSSVVCGFAGLHMWFLKCSGRGIRSASGFFIAGGPFMGVPGFPFLHFRLGWCSLTGKRGCLAVLGGVSWKGSAYGLRFGHGRLGGCLGGGLVRQCHVWTR